MMLPAFAKRARLARRPGASRGLLYAASLSVLLSACASNQPFLQQAIGPTLGDLSPITLPAEPTPVPEVSLEQIEQSYRDALAVVEDTSIRRRIQVRLADIEMMRSEEQQVTTLEQQAFFDEAIALYEQLLEEQAALDADNAADRPRLLYQLSKAYALDGRLQESTRALDELVRDFPNSEFAPEAHFRRAEVAFSSGDYERAEALYNRVLAAGQTPFYSNALYMHGWSLFKQGLYREALDSFDLALDDLLVEDVPLEQLPTSEQNLAADTLRIMGISFSYLEGADTIADLYRGSASNYYQHLLYRELGELYLETERYRDSAETFLRYAQLFPERDEAPLLSVRAIEAYEQGNFPSLMRPAKEEFVANYGINSRFWAERSIVQQEPLLPHLRQYLDELSSFYHARGQREGDATATGERRVDLMRAADYYQQFVSLFPMDESVSNMTFLMAEAFFEAGAWVDALLGYEKVAYHYMDPEHGAEAGYSALLALDEVIAVTAEEQRESQQGQQHQEQQESLRKWQDHKIESAIQFADNYPQDTRAPVVLADAAEDVFEQGNLEQAITLATRLTDWQPEPELGIQKTAWLIRAHSLFDLDLYSAAEESYRQALTLLSEDDEVRPDVVERIAASMYKQAEDQLQAENSDAAVQQLLAIRDIAPDSDIALTAQFDAANHLLDKGAWQQAEAVLLDFRERYPQHEYTDTIPAKLAMLYQETGDWQAAADTVSQIAENDPDPEVQQDSLYLAAELYQQAGNTAQAIIHYRSYAHTYPQPFDLATEARFQLVELYEQTDEPIKRNFWLQKLIDAHEQAGQDSTDRARYLAAFAANELAETQYHAFRAVKLKLPLKENLQRKKQAMEKTLTSYRRVLEYGIGEFTTQANSRLGMVYAELSRDLMESERPDGLNALELEQYELLLEEQAFPFEEKAIEIHATNAQRSWKGTYDEWVQESFEALAELLPARYSKPEQRQEVSRDIY